MAEIIASTYELLDRLGAGGGGVVYLAKHIRLEKEVVLKADKRKITTDPALLRREIDVLKNLSHPYIPQVYDFFVEGDTVYSAMEFIDGESLDKPLAMGVRFPQAQVIRWARQLLEALVYLHSPIHGNPPRGYVHADIKPANIMCRPNGDICLIDFNIALAIGEENVVGRSPGYASPEHYGLDYSSRGLGTKVGRTPLPGEATLTLSGEEEKQSVVSRRKIIPDERSDIYSIGATLYHLISGRRPSKDVTAVTPLTAEDASPQVCEIISKAMMLDPDQRYQTAAEMLNAFQHLHENDPRTLRRKRRIAVCAATIAFMFLLGVGSTFAGLHVKATEEEQARIAAEKKEAQERLAKEKEQLEKNALQMISDAREYLDQGDNRTATSLAIDALMLKTCYDAQAQKTLTDALGIYDLSDGFKSAYSAALSTEALKVSLSPEGKRLCALCAWELSVFDTKSGERLTVLPIEPSTLSCAVFLDEDRIAYAGPDSLRVYDLSEEKELWQGNHSTGITLSADGSRIASVYKDETVGYVYNASTGELLNTVSFDGRRQRVVFNDTFLDPKDNVFALNRDGSLLAVSFSDGGLCVYDLLNEGYIEIYDQSDYTHFEGGFSGKYLAVSAIGGGNSVFALFDMDALRFVGSIPGTTRFRMQVDESGIFMARDNLLVEFDPDTLTDQELAFTEKMIVSFRHSGNYTILATEDKRFFIYDRSAGEVKQDRTLADYNCDHVDLAGGTAIVGSMDSPMLRLLQLEAHPETEILTYEPAYRHNEARLSDDGRSVMLFRYDRFRICGSDGSIICDVELPDSEHVYDQQFRRKNGESYLEVIWYDGTVRCYSAVDGSILSEERREPPDESLYEEFFTSHYRITSPLHGTPAAYDRETGTLVRELEKDAYMTYITETGDYIISEYITAQGERYGLLLDQDLQTLAMLPDLCDVLDERLFFDYSSGNIRETHIYSLQELLDLAGQEKGRD